MPNYVIRYDNLPVRIPVWPTITAALALDRIGAHPIIWGAVGMLFLLYWAGVIYRFATTDSMHVSDIVRRDLLQDE
jgi:hypothetical protein